MPSTAFNPRGTSGSGKTTIAKAVLVTANAEPFQSNGKHIIMYRGELFKVPLYLLGSYASACGGCDTIPSVHIVAGLLKELMDDPAPKMVVYEGLMISHMLGTVGAAVKPYGERHVMGFLDTPLETCLLRIQRRRDARGTTKLFDPTNTIKDYGAVLNCRRNAIRDGFRVVDLNHQDSINESFKVLHELSRIADPSTLDQGTRQHSRQEGERATPAVDQGQGAG